MYELFNHLTLSEMRNFFFSLLSIVLIISSCSENEEVPVPETETRKAHFKVVYSQTGDLENFSRAMGIGSGFVFEESGEEVPMALFTEDLTDEKYTFITKEPLPSFQFGLSIKWISVTLEPGSMTAYLEVFRNDTLIDAQEMKVTSDDVAGAFQFEYEAK